MKEARKFRAATISALAAPRKACRIRFAVKQVLGLEQAVQELKFDIAPQAGVAIRMFGLSHEISQGFGAS